MLVLVCNRLEQSNGVFPLRRRASGWLPEDKAWQEHGYWFPFCVYIRFVKGHAFYRECLKCRKDRFSPVGFDTVDTQTTPL